MLEDCYTIHTCLLTYAYILILDLCGSFYLFYRPGVVILFILDQVWSLYYVIHIHAYIFDQEWSLLLDQEWSRPGVVIIIRPGVVIIIHIHAYILRTAVCSPRIDIRGVYNIYPLLIFRDRLCSLTLVAKSPIHNPHPILTTNLYIQIVNKYCSGQRNEDITGVVLCPQM